MQSYISQWLINQSMNSTPTRSRPQGVVIQVEGRVFSDIPLLLN